MYSTCNEEESVVVKRFIRTLKKYMTSISKNVYSDKLGDVVKKYNNTYYGNVKMKPVVVKSKTDIKFKKGNKYKDPKFKVSDYVRISKYKDIFAKGCVPNWS